jgi:hypothetical protein
VSIQRSVDVHPTDQPHLNIKFGFFGIYFQNLHETEDETEFVILVLTAVYEATTQRLYGRTSLTYALSSFKFYRKTLAHGRAVWQPVFHVWPCDGPSAAASECSSILPSNSSVASDSLPPAKSLCGVYSLLSVRCLLFL